MAIAIRADSEGKFTTSTIPSCPADLANSWILDMILCINSCSGYRSRFSIKSKLNHQSFQYLRTANNPTVANAGLDIGNMI